MTLEELHEKCRECDRCQLRKGATQVVPGEGNSNAEIMFIGEGPGATEDKEGRPFCGAAGRFLDELLGHIGLERSEVFIANMVKCRPPGNRDPQPDEMEACRPWLDKQIEVIEPKVIVPLGRFSMAKFIPDTKISVSHGKAFSKGDRIYFIMYHPAVALYQGSMRAVLKSDMENLKAVLAGEQEPETLLDVQEVSETKNSDELQKLKQASPKNTQIGLGL